MTSEKGNNLARVIAEDDLGDKFATDPRLGELSQKRIGDQLRAMYDDLVQQPVPDRFKDLLAREGDLERWYSFEARSIESALRQWCAENSLEIVET